MAVERITKRVVDAQQPTTERTFVWDSDVSGFGLKVMPSGHKSFIVQYRVAGLGRKGTTKRVTLGEYGTLTPEEARKLAKRELGRVAQGLDPAAERGKLKLGDSVEELGKAYLKDVRLRRKPTTVREYERLWKKHVLPDLGRKRVAGVSPQDVSRLHRSLHETPYIANRVLALVGAFFTFAAREGVRAANDNPARGVEAFEERAKERFLTAAEFKRLGQALVRADKVGLPASPEFFLQTLSQIARASRTSRDGVAPRPRTHDGCGTSGRAAMSGNGSENSNGRISSCAANDILRKEPALFT